jgi:hypothetical protein
MISPLTKGYCQRYDVVRISLVEMPGVVEGAESVCHMDIDFADDYRVQFKLPLADTPAADGVIALEGDGGIQVAPDRPGSDEETLGRFFAAIESRLAKIQHEQSVQNITYLGNTFVLNNKTVFDVMDDDDGRLTIEMHRGDERQQAMLLASSLLDGLYDGSIRLV